MVEINFLTICDDFNFHCLSFRWDGKKFPSDFQIRRAQSAHDPSPTKPKKTNYCSCLSLATRGDCSKRVQCCRNKSGNVKTASWGWGEGGGGGLSEGRHLRQKIRRVLSTFSGAVAAGRWTDRADHAEAIIRLTRTHMFTLGVKRARAPECRAPDYQCREWWKGNYLWREEKKKKKKKIAHANI